MYARLVVDVEMELRVREGIFCLRSQVQFKAFHRVRVVKGGPVVLPEVVNDHAIGDGSTTFCATRIPRTDRSH